MMFGAGFLARSAILAAALAISATLGVAATAGAATAPANHGDGERGAVYSLTNAAAGNAVAVFARGADGALTPAGAVATGGHGTGSGLGSQGALAPMPGSTRTLSNLGVGAAPGPAQVSFSPKGDALVVTEKATNRIDVYAVDKRGNAAGPAVYPAAGVTPFGFAFGKRGSLIVSEAFGGAPNGSATSSYRLDAGAHSISAFAVQADGSLVPIDELTGLGAGMAGLIGR